MTLSIGSRVPSTSLRTGTGGLPQYLYPSPIGSQQVPSTKLGTGFLVTVHPYRVANESCSLDAVPTSKTGRLTIFDDPIHWVTSPFNITRGRLSRNCSPLSGSQRVLLVGCYLPHVAGLENPAYSVYFDAF